MPTWLSTQAQRRRRAIAQESDLRHESAHRFYKLISGDFIKLGFKQSKSSHCLFVKCYGSENKIALLVLHVDDGGYFAKDLEVIEKDLTMLRRKYKLDHEPMSWYVGLRIVIQDGSIGMLCDAYIEQCAKRFGIDKMAPQTHPASEAPVKFMGESTCRKRYMELVGCLLYISTACRPDITAVTNMLASQMSNPSQRHLHMAEGVLSYLLSTKAKGLKFNKASVKGKSDMSRLRNMKLEGFFDSDFADDKSRKSRTGFVIYYNGNLISWISKLQSLHAQSVFEAETIAGNEAYKTIKFLRKIVADISCGKEPMGIILQGDNERAIECAKTGIYGKRSKHFEVRLLNLSDGHQKRIIVLQHVPTQENPADLFTKIVKANILKHLVDRLVVRVA